VVFVAAEEPTKFLNPPIPIEVQQKMKNTINELTELCDSAYHHDRASWDQEAKFYRGSDGPDRAKTLSEQLATCRNALVGPVLAAVKDRHEGHLLVVPGRKSKPYTSGRYEPQTWMDLRYSETREGVPLKFAKYDKRWNKFRIWFTAAGVGIGVSAAPGKTGHQGRLAALSTEVPCRFVDRQPSSTDWERNGLLLRGINSRCHIYLADWWSRFEDDDDFLTSVADCWSILGKTLEMNRHAGEAN